MMFRRSLLIGAAACLAGPARATGTFPYAPVHSFAAWRSGQRIGTHALAFAETGGQRQVTTTIDFAVRAVGLVVYRYRHVCTETLSTGALAALTSQTDDDGVAAAVEARAGGGGLAVRRRNTKVVVKAGGSPDEAAQQGGWTSETLPADLLPSTHWNIEQVRRGALLNSQTGTIAKVTIVPGPRETVRTVGSSLEASRYTYTGDIRMNQWFDERGRWVKSAFQVFDGSTIEYILQE